ncbi:hypothetical protein CGGC5_v011192 [Colletotrichum fructicola Nara gc5]|uniref:Uncharacterized protein n=1 Tax=Colletotrichum fructicola (strain Nara gc5) TaxID=1213859 RepID=A0A7J6ITU9_COLFN|nr:hypothetical protein CGGC5_v011192 [Colletotrichum fructicola Nara gc5]
MEGTETEGKNGGRCACPKYHYHHQDLPLRLHIHIHIHIPPASSCMFGCCSFTSVPSVTFMQLPRLPLASTEDKHPFPGTKSLR